MMKMNDVRKLAKQIRTGVCELGYEEMCNIVKEIEEYGNSEAAAAWTDRTVQNFKNDVQDIVGYMEKVRPLTEQEKEEAKEEVPRRNFKTILLQMHDKKYPVLEAVKWFATVYARDGYEKAKRIRGMIERRGYVTKDGEYGFYVYDMWTGEIAASVVVAGTDVTDFRMCA